jgi:AcrR family transcriptional regulator
MEEKEINIIKKVSELFKKYGIKSVSMDDIAQHLCISKKTLYQYFKDKADLVCKVVNVHNCEKDNNFFEIISKDLNAIDALLAVSKHLINLLKDVNPPILYDLRKYYPELTKDLIINRREHVFNNIKNNIIKGIDEGLYRTDLNPEIISTLYVRRLDDVIFEDEDTLNKYPQHELFTQMFIYHIRGIVSSKGMIYFETKIKNEPLI